MKFYFRFACARDLPALLALEQRCFAQDRLSARSFRWMLRRAHADLIVAEDDGGRLLGYALLLYRRGSALARLYSLAIAAGARGQGLGAQLLKQAEASARGRHCSVLRLEVRGDNGNAIRLYESSGYGRFGVREDYYQDHAAALRYQKRFPISPTSAE